MFVAKNFNVEAPLVLLAMGALEGYPLPDPPRSAPKFVWAVEADAAFAGDVRAFFDGLRADASDLLSTGYSIADRRWWAFSMQTLATKASFSRASWAEVVSWQLRTPAAI